MNTDYLQKTFGLSGRTALVTGSARGIGREIALALGRAGARVVISDINEAACAATTAQFLGEGIDARGAPFDVADLPAVQAAQRTLAEAGWQVDILVNNAGNQNRKPLVDMLPGEWQSLMNVHVNGAFNCTQTFLRGMCSQGFGRIITTSSVSAEATMPNIAAYTTAKGALAAFTRAVAVEYAAYGITANAIAPGFVRTEFTTGLQTREGFEQCLRQAVPVGRWAVPEDVAPAVLFLASAGASFITGQLLAIDGGMLASM